MNCAKCGAAMSPIATYCPSCGAAALDEPEPQRSRDIGELSADELMVRRRRVLFIGFAILLLVVMLSKLSWIPWTMFGGRGWGGNGWEQSGWDNGWGDKSPAVTTASELFDAYRDNRNAARHRFGHRPLLLSGTVIRVEVDPKWGPDVMMRTNDPSKVLRIDLAEESYDESKSLTAGQTLDVGCARVMETLGPDPWLRSCRILKPGELPASPPAPPLPPVPPSLSQAPNEN